MRPTRPVVFVDDGGILSDNRRRGLQWQRLVAAFFSERLGGPAEAWQVANRDLVPPLWMEFFGADLEGESYRDRYDRYLLRWLQVMCAGVGLVSPPDPQALQLAWEATLYVTERVDAAIPGSVEAVRSLHEAGFELHTASGEASWELERYLTQMGIRTCFGLLFGPDLVDVLKWSGPGFYGAIFEAARVPPERAIVIDNDPQQAAWAEQAGGIAIVVGDRGAFPNLAAWLDSGPHASITAHRSPDHER